jgi:hypothetical protein
MLPANGWEEGENLNARGRASFLKCYISSFLCCTTWPSRKASSSVIWDNLASESRGTLHDESDFNPKPVKPEPFGFRNAHSKHLKCGMSVVNLCCSLVSSGITSTMLQSLCLPSLCARFLTWLLYSVGLPEY